MPLPIFNRILPKTAIALLSATAVPGIVMPASAQSESVAPAAISGAPKLRFENRLLQGTLGKAYEGALDNLLRVNIVPDTEGTHNKAGLMAKPPGTFIKAGGGYSEPWTRDASLNSWNAASLLSPVEARNTLWAVCERENGKVVLQRDDQWWDKVIWIPAAWNHYKVTGDRQFLQTAYEVAQDELGLMQREHFSTAYGLFQGPAFFCDGIAGYPEPEYDPKNRSSFVLSHPYTKDLMALSTNCVYHGAFLSAAEMAKALGRPAGEARAFEASAGTLKTAINKHLWNPAKSTYGYFIHGAGPLVGQRDETQEGIGLAYAILFGVADGKQTQSILKGAHRTAYGIPTQWPHFPRFSDEKPGRHNVIMWPVVNGMWASAAAKSGDLNTFQQEVENLVLLTMGSQGRFYEIYNPITGAVDGGWQVGRQWPSQPEQTWSATAYLRMMYQGLFGMDFQPNGLALAPKLPAQWGAVSLNGVRYRNMTLDVALSGKGSKIDRVLIDGKASKQAFVPATLTGQHSVVISMKE
jgi:glycogen debranching enzyme